MKAGPSSPQPHQYTNKILKDELNPNFPSQSLRGRAPRGSLLGWSLGMCLGHPCLAPWEFCPQLHQGYGLRTSQGQREAGGESLRTVPCQAETLCLHPQAFHLLELRAYSLWGLATMRSVSSHQEPHGMPDSREVWPLWRHCQSLACSQPTAGTHGQAELQFPSESWVYLNR